MVDERFMALSINVREGGGVHFGSSRVSAGTFPRRWWGFVGERGGKSEGGRGEGWKVEEWRSIGGGGGRVGGSTR